MSSLTPFRKPEAYKSINASSSLDNKMNQMNTEYVKDKVNLNDILQEHNTVFFELLETLKSLII